MQYVPVNDSCSYFDCMAILALSNTTTLTTVQKHRTSQNCKNMKMPTSHSLILSKFQNHKVDKVMGLVHISMHN